MNYINIFSDDLRSCCRVSGCQIAGIRPETPAWSPSNYPARISQHLRAVPTPVRLKSWGSDKRCIEPCKIPLLIGSCQGLFKATYSCFI